MKRERGRLHLKHKRFLIAMGIVVIIGIVLLRKTPDIQEVTATYPTYGTIEKEFSTNGVLKPVTEVKISSELSGEIIELHHEEGDSVAKGDLIIKINQENYISLVEMAQASLNAVETQYRLKESQVRQSELNYRRYKKMYENRVISQVEFEEVNGELEIAKKELKAAKYNVNRAIASLNEAKENLNKTNIYSPMNGTISAMNVEIGERVVGTSQMSGTELFRVANLDEFEVLAEIGESDIVHIAVGDSATIKMDAYPNHTFIGKVSHIANSAKSDNPFSQHLIYFVVKILIDKNSYSELSAKRKNPFKPGMSANVSIKTERKIGVLNLPLHSVKSKRDSLTAKYHDIVYVIGDDMRIEEREIVCGIDNLKRVEIISGLTADEKVVCAPFNIINNGLEQGIKVSIKSYE
ncbi:MAG: efflux RND transporter periplasmic adaptor subunit [Bacteroidales bacterium]|nr:efflux RND transporter periplasmic adaptor subunit [Bacteroidales bacterium]